MNIVFISSGGGGTIKFLNYAIEILKLDINIIKIICDRECGSYFFAINNGLNVNLIKYTRENNENLIKALKETNFDLAVTLITKIIDKETLISFQDKFINLHYSLLPAFQGMIDMKTVEEAKKKNVKFIGSTCHFVDEYVDNGKIIQQCSIPVNWTMDLDFVKEMTFRSACFVFLNSLLMLREKDNSISANIINIMGQNINFNPGLKFCTDNFDEKFWEKIKIN